MSVITEYAKALSYALQQERHGPVRMTGLWDCILSSLGSTTLRMHACTEEGHGFYFLTLLIVPATPSLTHHHNCLTGLIHIPPCLVCIGERDALLICNS